MIFVEIEIHINPFPEERTPGTSQKKKPKDETIKLS